MTTQTLNHGSASAIRLIDRIGASVRMVCARISDHEGKRATDAAIADLTAEQLDDVGIRSRDDTRPVITVEAGLMARAVSFVDPDRPEIQPVLRNTEDIFYDRGLRGANASLRDAKGPIHSS